MTDNRTPEQHMAEVAGAALAGPILGRYDNMMCDELWRLGRQLVLLGQWATTHGDADGRRLTAVAAALELIENATVADIVRRIAATLPQR